MAHPLLKRARAAGAPLIEGETVTFVWRGRRAPGLVGDFNEWEPARALPFEPVAPGLWAASLNLPRDAYMEYSYLCGGERSLDPLNARQTPNGLGEMNNYFYMPESGPSPLLEAAAGLRGQMLRRIMPSQGHDLRGEFMGRQRQVWFYQPPAAEPCPLLVVYDGREYLRLGRLPRIVDNLIEQKRIRPVALALVANGGQRFRGVEYACNEATAGFVANQLVPFARAELNLLDPAEHPGAYGVMGASMGGLMALYTALRHPELFGHVLSQSGALGLDETETVVFDLVRDSPRKPLKIWMDIGAYDKAELIPANRRMAALLKAKGYPVTYGEYPGGHNHVAWRNEVGQGLEMWLGELA
jgi:enterochelin esterase family protein